MRVFFTLISIILFFYSCKKETTNFPTLQHFKYTQQWKYNLQNNQLTLQYNNQQIETYPLNPKRIIVNGTASIGYLKALNLQSTIIGVTNPEYIYDSLIHQKLVTNEIQSIGNQTELNLEKIYKLQPDIFISYSDTNLIKLHENLKKLGIKVLLIDDFNETSPLGRAEWIKIFGFLFSKKKEAEIYFNKCEKNYLYYKKLAATQNKKPSVLTDIMYGDVWYLPKKDSYIAQLIQDAGGNYLFSTNTLSSLSFEQVYTKAHHADKWINASDCKSITELLGKNNRYHLFNSLEKNEIYAITGKKNVQANDYFETGTTRPDLIIKDLYTIFYLKDTTKLYYYKKLTK